MWGTILIDVYREADAPALHGALEDICSPFDNWDFSSAGVYCYWRPSDREVLYIGLARDLPQRFAQHSGLIRFLETGCKVRQIRAYFEKEQELGFSAVVQSPLSQPITYRQLALVGKTWSDIHPGDRAWSEKQIDNLRRLEGGLLKVHQLRYRRLPAWNSIGGSRRAAQMASADDDTLDLLSGRADSLLIARRPLRELSAQPRLAWLENWLHTARFSTVARCLVGGEPITDARIRAKIATLSETMKERESLDKLGYLERHPLDGGPPVDMTPIYGP